jgi:outer membrane protein assembly factor BamD (BamD/ComL family)
MIKRKQHCAINHYDNKFSHLQKRCAIDRKQCVIERYDRTNGNVDAQINMESFLRRLQLTF